MVPETEGGEGVIERTKFSAWVSKYAMTKGIYEIEAEDCFDISPTMVHDRGAMYTTFYHKDEWHRSEAEAVAKAEAMRTARIKSLEKQIARLKAMRFEIKETP